MYAKGDAKGESDEAQKMYHLSAQCVIILSVSVCKMLEKSALATCIKTNDTANAHNQEKR